VPRFLQGSTTAPAPDDDFYQSLEPELQIFLGNNFLSTLPPSIWSVQSLTVLSLRNNQLESIPGSISKLVNLRELNLANNQLRWLPWELLSLLGPGKSLKKLFLSNNYFYKGTKRLDDGTDKSPWRFPDSKDSLQSNIADLESSGKEKTDVMWQLKLCKSILKTVGASKDISTASDPLWASLAYHTVHIASTDVSVFRMDGSIDLRGRARSIPPSIASKSVTVLKTHTDSVSRPLSKHASGAPSLLELAIASCARHPEVKVDEMVSYLPSDTPEPLIRALRVAEDARLEGGRICSVCGRNYIIPRTEWIEFWHWVPEKAMAMDEDEMFWPFLRRGCSTLCVP
jgi:Leucine rich repeat